jgi:D-amino-acid oxidase
MPEQVSVVGGGVVGLSVGTFLNLKGYDTQIYTKEIPYEDETPALASNYAAASVKPVVVDSDELGKMTRRSEGFFEVLERETDTVRQQKNFVVYEEGGGRPDHADALRGYETLKDHDGVVPRREGTDTGGYVHEVFFVEMPEYVPELLRWYRETGGKIQSKEVEKREVRTLDGDVVVNCTGYGNMFGDGNVVAKKGHLVHVETDGLVRDREGEVFSYTYYTDDGFVYAYPRKDCLVLGGSVYEGDVVDGGWVGEEADEKVQAGGVEVPRRIIEVNRELLRRTAGIDIEEYEKQGRFGYRPYRDGGVRTEKEKYDGKDVVHCYGHGGAGVTLSWLSANRVYNLVSGSSGFEYSVLDGLP